MTTKWNQVSEQSVPDDIRFDHASGADQGQMVDVQYGFFGATMPREPAYKRVIDRSVGPDPTYYKRV